MVDLEFVPDALAPFVASQDDAHYDEADQATWRFVLLHLHEHLQRHAHPSYTAGLRDTGLGIERIPRIEHIDTALQRLGWRAVCVSGFIPPRAFQGFQAAGILPIAAEIRDPQHIAYTPAPDIIHEAAGHAPMLVNDEYAAFLRKIGEVGQHPFACPEDIAVYEAIAHLSVVKEQPAATKAQRERAQERLQAALAAQTIDSEATRLARLYWWTAEYGLVGTPSDFRLYGAGLLSSLGEALFCRDPEGDKRPLSVACLDVDYDITRPQPQLFVAAEFGHLLEVLDDARGQLAVTRSLAAAGQQAQQSRLPARLEHSDGLIETTTIHDTVLDLAGELIAVETVDGVRPAKGRRDNATLLEGEPTTLDYAGLTIRGYVESCERHRVMLRDAQFTWPAGERVADRASVPLAPITRILPGDRMAPTTAPPARPRSEAQRRLRELYAEGYEAWRQRSGGEAAAIFAAIHDHLREYPDDWLLRWNLLESLIKLGPGDLADGETSDPTRLARELEHLEVRFAHRQPIATGLRSLRRLGTQTERTRP